MLHSSATKPPVVYMCISSEEIQFRQEMEKEGGSSTGTSIFPGMEFNLEPGPLKELSPEKIKEEIKRWAKAVITYARQLSFGSLDKAESCS